jgi:hypothetical protein
MDMQGLIVPVTSALHQKMFARVVAAQNHVIHFANVHELGAA